MQVTWMSKRGAGCLRCFGKEKDCIAFISTLRCEATVWSDTREKIGGVEESDGRHDDRRVKWIWWFERNAA